MEGEIHGETTGPVVTRLGTIGELHVLTVHTSDRTFVSVSGALDIATCDHLEDSLLSALALTTDAAVLEMDVSDVDFADSTGAMVLTKVRRAARDRGVDVVLTHPSRQLRFLLEVLEQSTPEARPGADRQGSRHPEVGIAT
jgi:anti-anti-sigma factor